MSHSRERAEKICLNCKASLYGRYCHVCGQENIEPKETFLGLVSHFFYDITHFDGKFFTSVGLLIRKPGFLSKEYIKGRRASYLNPVRMYVFTSAFYFILFFSFYFNVKDLEISEPAKREKDDSVAYDKHTYDKWALKAAKTKEDSARILEGLEEAHKITDSLKNIIVNKDSLNKAKKGIQFKFDTAQYKSVSQYDSLQKLLPASERDGWLTRAVRHRQIELDPEYRKDSQEFFRKWVEKFTHLLPQMLFLSLPLIALVLQLLYLRRRREYFFVSHGIFLIHIYIYSFINLLVIFTIEKMIDVFRWDWLQWLQLACIIHAIWYVYKSMRNFYGQGLFKTLTKFLLLNLFTFSIVILLFAVFILVSAWNL